jgi:hypothetical protein
MPEDEEMPVALCDARASDLVGEHNSDQLHDDETMAIARFQDNAGEQDLVDPGEEATWDVPLFVRRSAKSSSATEWGGEDAAAPTLPHEEGVDTDTASESLDESEGVEPEHGYAGNVSATDFAVSDANEREEKTERILSVLSELEDRLEAIEVGQTSMEKRFDAFSDALHSVACRPVPRPDVVEFNRGLARLTTALAQTLRRMEEAVEANAHQSVQGESDLARGLATLAEAVKALHECQGGTVSELAVISSMQETQSHQLAKLLESSHTLRASAMDEFLLDVRHATAELIAEQMRALRVG